MTATLTNSRKLPSNRPNGLTIQEDFENYNRNNPAVYNRMVELAYAAKQRGMQRVSIQLILELMRWEEYDGGVQIASGFKDKFRSRYARLIMKNNPDLDGLFEVRKLHRR